MRRSSELGERQGAHEDHATILGGSVSGTVGSLSLITSFDIRTSGKVLSRFMPSLSKAICSFEPGQSHVACALKGTRPGYAYKAG